MIVMRRKGKQTPNRAHFSPVRGFAKSREKREKRENRTDKLDLLIKEYFGK